MNVEEHVDFVTIREDFNEFEAENGQILKIKKVIVDIRRPVENGQLQATVQMQDVIHVITPREIDTDGMATALDITSVTDEDIIKNLSFKPKKTILNIYETEASILLVDIQVTSIRATNKLDATGNPYLRFKTIFGINIIPKPKPNTDNSNPNMAAK